MRMLVLITLACIALGAACALRNWPATEYRLYRLRALEREPRFTPHVLPGVHYHCSADAGGE